MGARALICTPGRFLSVRRAGWRPNRRRGSSGSGSSNDRSVKGCPIVVLDEADALLGFNFRQQTLKALEVVIGEGTQFLAFSATFTPQSIELLDGVVENIQSKIRENDGDGAFPNGLRKIFLCHSLLKHGAEKGDDGPPQPVLLGLRYFKLIVGNEFNKVDKGYKYFDERQGTYREDEERNEIFEQKCAAVMRLLSGLTFRQAIVFCNDEYR
eukprot:GHVN01001820.1.p1 GENE.GHVN01001820.1~~GHVN01001820.1.p1  ORF type:complete len:212 (+),score=27.45 GHVN01001820.1:510-1145(+)